MPIDDASSNSVNDAIMRLYLYGDRSRGAPAGNGTSPFVDEAAIRPRGATTTFEIGAQTYKDGPGRFAMPELFELVRLFFNASLTQLGEIIGGVADANGEIRITRDIVRNYYDNLLYNNNGNFGLAFNQAYFDDGKDDYFQRVFIWGTSSFQIGDAEFVYNPTTGARRIENFNIVNRPSKDGQDENFDFSGGGFTNAFRLAAQPRLDPFGIGRTVNINLTNKDQLPTYTYYDWEYQAQLTDPARIAARTTLAGYDNAKISSIYGGLGTTGVYNGELGSARFDGFKAAFELGDAYEAYYQRIYAAGVVTYRDDGYDIYYGTGGDDGPISSLANNSLTTDGVYWKLGVPYMEAAASPGAPVVAVAALGPLLALPFPFNAVIATATAAAAVAIGAPHLNYQNKASGVAAKGAIIFAGAGDDVAIGLR